MDENILRSLIDLRDRTIQKSRVAFSNRIGAVERGVDVPSNGSQELLERWLHRFNELEAELDGDIRQAVKGLEIVDRMIEVKGVGPMLAAKVVCMIDIREADTISALWRYAGYAVIDGTRERLAKGEKLHYNIRLKTTCYLVGSSFLKSDSPYRRIYDDARAYYEANRPDWTKGHQHNASMRKMIKIWLSHLWLVWRQTEGLDVRAPYVHEKLGHEHEYTPEEFGWSAVSIK
jgi:hypothetical protein